MPDWRGKGEWNMEIVPSSFLFHISLGHRDSTPPPPPRVTRRLCPWETTLRTQQEWGEPDMEHTTVSIKSPPSIITTAELCSLLLQAPLLHNWKLSLDLIKFVNSIANGKENPTVVPLSPPTFLRGYQCYAIDRPLAGQGSEYYGYIGIFGNCQSVTCDAYLFTYRLPYL
ncbi:hypothetical protein GE21DRAFT_1076304 [Neurospora crassa]|nr:hypothetical protein GE21DRAFT_1076304 [Neurospora crassa]